ncbi:ParB/RepB/Spo0J family partition protein [Conexibacter woesei]|uniref:ParB/RepB/Spo0J family partition protein n=1 Tax=Conexibacter woesei TaxID=191495 RepID=UPI0004259CF6|nr:ParB/RepB/Spo0J family partition protein [Conexibacter woesei]
MSQVDKLQQAEEDLAQMREEAAKAAKEEARQDLQKAPLSDTAKKAHQSVVAPLSQVKTMVNMRVGQLPDLHELAVSIKETGLLHPPLVRATGDDDTPYELLAGRRRFGAMTLLDEAEGAREDWRFTLIDGISKREALTMQFAENFHQSKPEPVQFARAARAIMAEDPSLTAAEVSRLVGAPLAWTRKSLKLLDLPEGVVTRVEEGDLSFTVADIVRRGIARGDVSAEEATELVEQATKGEISTAGLKLGVGYVPPKPKNYEEESRKLDEARWAANREKGLGKDQDADQRDWDGGASSGGANGSQGGPIRDGGDLAGGPQTHRIVASFGGDRDAAEGAPIEVDVTDLDAYILGLVLSRVATADHRSHLGVEGGHEATQEYAYSLHPNRRLEVLRALGAEILASDPLPPKALRALLPA